MEPMASTPKKPSFRKQRSFTASDMKMLKLKLHSAIIGHFSDPRRFFRKYDRDKDGFLEHEELKRCIRLGMKVKPSDLSDEHIVQFIDLLDDDDDGFITVDEICAFVGISPEDGSSLDPNGRGGKNAAAAATDSAAAGGSKKDGGNGNQFVKSMTTAGGNLVHKVRRAFANNNNNNNGGGSYSRVKKHEGDHNDGGAEVAEEEEEEDRKLMIAIIVMLSLVFLAIIDGFTTRFGARGSLALAVRSVVY